MMKTTESFPPRPRKELVMNSLSRISRPILLIPLLAGVLGVPCYAQQSVPDAINYQGTLIEPTTGDPAAEGTYVVEFRIFGSPSGGSVIWAKRFAINVITNGLFNVLISDNGSPSNLSPTEPFLADAFGEALRFLELAIVTDPGGDLPSPLPLSPRQRLVSAPFAMQAEHAHQATVANALQGDGGAGDAVTLNSAGDVTMTTDLAVGADLTVGGGLTVMGGPLDVDAGGMDVVGDVVINGALEVLAEDLTVRDGDLNVAAGKVQEGGNPLLPRGVIVMWSGLVSAIPAGWTLCNGTAGAPDLRGKFVVGYNGGDTDYNAAGKTGGAKTVALSVAQMPSHNHGNTGSGHSHNYFFRDGTGDNSSGDSSIPNVDTTKTDANGTIRYLPRVDSGIHTHSNNGSGSAHENRPAYYVIAFIMKL